MRWLRRNARSLAFWGLYGSLFVAGLILAGVGYWRANQRLSSIAEDFDLYEEIATLDREVAELQARRGALDPATQERARRQLPEELEEELLLAAIHRKARELGIRRFLHQPLAFETSGAALVRRRLQLQFEGTPEMARALFHWVEAELERLVVFEGLSVRRRRPWPSITVQISIFAFRSRWLAEGEVR